MSKRYTLTACEDLMSRYYEAGGECLEVVEGCLGLGLTICYGDGLKTAVIREEYANPWTPAHTIRFYNVMPKKYERMIDEWYAREDEFAA